MEAKTFQNWRITKIAYCLASIAILFNGILTFFFEGIIFNLIFLSASILANSIFALKLFKNSEELDKDKKIKPAKIASVSLLIALCALAVSNFFNAANINEGATLSYTLAAIGVTVSLVAVFYIWE